MSDDLDPGSWDVQLAENTDLTDLEAGDRHALVDLVNRLLDKGVVISGDVTISVAGVDLVYLGLNAVLTSVATARQHMGRPVGRE